MHIIENDDIITFQIEEDLDSKNGPEIRKEILKKLRATNIDAIIDLSKVNYIDSSGINVLLTANKLQIEKKKNLIIKNAEGSVKKSIELSNLDKLFTLK